MKPSAEQSHPKPESSLLYDRRYSLRRPQSNAPQLTMDILKHALDCEVMGLLNAAVVRFGDE